MNPWTHLQQPPRYGCCYYALAAITGDPSVIPEDDVLRELNFERMRFRVRDRYDFNCQYRDEKPAPHRVWLRLRDLVRHREGEYVPLYVAIEEKGATTQYHAVAIALYGTHVVVLNPAKEYAMSFSWDLFLKSRYAKAYFIYWVLEAALESHPPRRYRGPK